MIKPVLQDRAFLDDVAATRNDSSESFRLWWLGQSGFLIQYQGKHLLLDPYLSDSLTTKYATTDKPHVRMTERVIAPEKLDFIDVVTSSHNHTDHLDADTLSPLFRVNPQIHFALPEANRAFAADRLKIDIGRTTGLTAGQKVKAGAFELIGTPAAHNSLDKDEKGHHKYMGFVIRFGKWCIYHTGDTIRFPGQEGIFKGYSPQLALLPINGDRPERRVAGNLDGNSAALVAKDGGAPMIIPMHYDLFEFNTASPEDEFIPACNRLRVPFRVLRAGERFTSDQIIRF